MTVEIETIEPFDYTLDGVTRVFTVPFRLLEAGHLRVLIVEEDGTETVLEDGEDYELDEDAIDAGEDHVELTLFNAAGTSGKRLVGFRDIPLTRHTELAPGPFPPERVDLDLDRLVMQDQQLQEQIERALLLPVGSNLRNVRLPGYDRGKFLRWSDFEGVLENALPGVDDVEIPGSTVTTKYPDDADLSTASGFNNSRLLNDFLQEMSDGGGGKFVLESPNGLPYFFEDSIRVPSFVTLECVSGMLLGPRATVGIAGDRRYAHVGLRLVSDAAEGATNLIVDTAPLGGGPVSSYFKVGGAISITGLRNGSGSPLEQEGNTVVGINDGLRRIILAEPISYAYEVEYAAGDYEEEFDEPNLTLINVAAVARITLDTVLRSDQVTVNSADVGLLSADDWVMIEDDRRTSSTTTYIEIAQVIAVGEDGENVVTLNRKLRRAYLVSENARLTILDPARRAAIVGASVQFTEEAEAEEYVPTFEIRYAIDSVMIDVEVANVDPFGSRGQMFRTHKAYNCGYVRPSGRGPKFTNEGEGNGVVFAYSTRCWADQPILQGCRHAVEFIAATECAAEEVDATDGRLTQIDFHGLNSVGCLATIRRVSFSGRTASASNGAVAFGNATWLDGDHECVVLGGEIGPFEGNSGVYGIRAFPPSTSCFAINVRANQVEKFWLHRDIPSQGTLVTRNCGMIGCTIDGGHDRVIDLQGRANGASVDTLQGFIIRDCDGQGLFRGIYAEDVTDLALHDVRLKFSSPDASSERSAARFVDCTGLRLIDVLGHKANRGWDITNCPGALFLKCDLLDLGDTQWLRDRGGNNGTEFRGCNAYTASGAAVVADETGGSTIVYQAVGNIGTVGAGGGDLPDASATDKVLARVSSGAGPFEEATFTDAGQAIVAAATAHAQGDLVHVQGANIASATTTDLSGATGMAVTITGTTTITGLGTVTAGRIRILTFAGILQLTHNATSLILPGGGNIVTAAGDVAVMLSLGSGNWKCIAYQRAAGTMALQVPSAVAITGGSIGGITDLAVADGGTGASNGLGALDNFFAKGSNIASASTTDLTGATAFWVDVTGTTTITALGALGVGDMRLVRFTGSLTLTHNATSLILPTGANIQTAAGDMALFIGLGSGNMLCAFYQRAAGSNVMSAVDLRTFLGLRKAAIEVLLDGGGEVIPVGFKVPVRVPFDCTVASWHVLAPEQSGAIVVDVWKDTYANFPPTVADTIAGTEKPTITATGNKGQDLSLSTWANGGALTEGDILIFNVDSVATLEKVLVTLEVLR